MFLFLFTCIKQLLKKQEVKKNVVWKKLKRIRKERKDEGVHKEVFWDEFEIFFSGFQFFRLMNIICQKK